MYTVLVIAVLFLTIVPVGTAVFVLGFIAGDSPCILCWQQRIGMALIALIGLFVLRYGPKPKYLGMAVLVGAWGVFMGLRHSSLHLARDVGQGFSVELFGAHTYTWSLFIFWCCLAAIGVLLMMARRSDLVTGPPRVLRGVDRAAFAMFVVVMAANIVQAFASTGPPPFAGQSDPVRFTFNPRHWVWSIDEYLPVPISLRGRWAIEKPDVGSVDPNPATGPLHGLPQLKVDERRPLKLSLRGRPTALAYDPASARFLLTTEHGVYILSDALDRVLRYTVVDPLFSVDLGNFSGAAFFPDARVVAISENKSFVILRESEQRSGGEERNYRYFLESFNDFDEVSRSRFSTVRAKMMYVMAAAFDPASQSILTIAVPNARMRRMVVSRFDVGDMTLSEEFIPSLAPEVLQHAPGVASEPGSPLDDLYVTAATIENGRLYALSAAHSTLLTIDLASRTVVEAHTIAGLRQPTGLALRDGELVIVSADGTVGVVRWQ
jgi:disulfide bond formation protein DsbB